MDTIGIIELPGSAYLYALAFVAAAFVGFSSIVLVIRQTIGVTLSRFQVLLARTDIELGFVVVGLSLLPMLISLFNLPHGLVLRGSSGIAALVLGFWLAIFAYRYRKATSAKLPVSAWLHLAIAVAVVIALAGNASGYTEPQVGLYALALSYVLAEAVDTFLHSTNVMLRQNGDVPSFVELGGTSVAC